MSGWQARGAVRRIPRAFLVVATVLLTLASAGCGGSPASQAAAPSKLPGVGRVTTAPDGVQEVTIQTQDDYAFTPNRFTVRPGRVRLTVVNTATQLTHNFRFTPGKGAEAIPQDIALLAPGQRETIAFTVHTPGSDPFECSFHTQLGQAGTMTVAGGK